MEQELISVLQGIEEAKKRLYMLEGVAAYLRGKIKAEKEERDATTGPNPGDSHSEEPQVG